MFKYIKAAFWNRWNLLALAAGAGVAAFSLDPNIAAGVLALVAAGEITYLVGLASHPKYQAYIEAQEHKARRQGSSKKDPEAVLRRIMASLPRDSAERYGRLRRQCMDLRDIASKLHQSHDDRYTGSLESMQLASLDRLLWIFLRLLYTKHALSLFLEKTDEDAIKTDISQTEQRLEQLAGDDSPHSQKLKRTLTDNLATCQQRLANYAKAQGNHEFVKLEIDRLENKIKSLAELAVNRSEQNFVSEQVDQVAESMVDTEQTMAELSFVTGLTEEDEETPQLLSQPIEILE